MNDLDKIVLRIITKNTTDAKLWAHMNYQTIDRAYYPRPNLIAYLISVHEIYHN